MEWPNDWEDLPDVGKRCRYAERYGDRWLLVPCISVSKTGISFNLPAHKAGFSPGNFIWCQPSKSQPECFQFHVISEEDKKRLTFREQEKYKIIRRNGSYAEKTQATGRVNGLGVMAKFRPWIGQAAELHRVVEGNDERWRCVFDADKQRVEDAELTIAGSDPVTAELQEPDDDIATSYGELATKLGMPDKDAERTLKRYASRGMPGRPAKRGCRDGHYVVSECARWIVGFKTHREKRTIDAEQVVSSRDELAVALQIGKDRVSALIAIDGFPAEATHRGKNRRFVLADVLRWIWDNRPEYRDHLRKRGVDLGKEVPDAPPLDGE